MANKRGIGIILGLVAMAGAAIAFAFAMPEREESHRIYAAWYVQTPSGPTVVVEHQTHLGSVSYGGDSRRDVDAYSAARLYSYSAESGQLQATYPLPQGGQYSVVGVSGDKLWLRIGAEPFLLSAQTLQLVGDRSAILAGAGSKLGGDFVLSHPSGRMHFYDGHLEVKGADGNNHYVSNSFEYVAPDDARKIPPEGYNCDASGKDLISPMLKVCLSPNFAPVTTLVTSYKSALNKDTPLLSGLSGSEVLWTRNVASLASGSQPAELRRAQAVDPERVVLLVQTGDMEIHTVFVDPATGKTLESKPVVQPAATES